MKELRARRCSLYRRTTDMPQQSIHKRIALCSRLRGYLELGLLYSEYARVP